MQKDVVAYVHKRTIELGLPCFWECFVRIYQDAYEDFCFELQRVHLLMEIKGPRKMSGGHKSTMLCHTNITNFGDVKVV